MHCLFHKALERVIHTGHKPPEPELAEYIKKMRIEADKNLSEGKIKVIMIYANTCPVCHLEFKYFSNKTGNEFLGVTLDNKMSAEGKKNKETITDHILFVEVDDQFGKELIDEADDWAKKTGNSNYKIMYTPTFLDFKTHEQIVHSYQTKRPLLDMLDDKKIRDRRSSFKILATKIMDYECNKVACGLDSAVKNPKSIVTSNAQKTEDGSSKGKKEKNTTKTSGKTPSKKSNKESEKTRDKGKKGSK